MIKLEYVEGKDIEKIIEWNKDKSADFLLQWAGPQYQYPLTEEQIIQRLINGANKEDSDTYIYKIILIESGEMIGTIELSKIDKINRTARVCRFLIGEEQWRGKGIGKTALEQVVKSGFIALKLKKVTLGVFDFNAMAIKCYEGVGFKKEKLIENARKAENGSWNVYEMAITREEWLNRNIVSTKGQLELLDSVKPLWEKLITHHRNVSKIFAKSFENKKFEDRVTEFTGRADTHQFRIELVCASNETEYIGYCISSISNQPIGEIDSIYVETPYRGLGIGDLLMQSALKWMDSNEVRTKKISVASENDAVLSFYEKHGFRVRSLVLEQVNNI